MSLLALDLQVVKGVASAGTGGAAFAIVSAVDPDGIPVLLDEGDFTFTLIEAGAGREAPMQHVFNGERSSVVRFFSLFPGPKGSQDPWSEGEFFVLVRAQSARGDGLAVGALTVPRR